MRQEINLFLTLPNKSRVFITEALIVQVAFGFAILLFCITMYQHYLMDRKETRVAVLQQMLVTQTQNLARATQQQMLMAQNGSTIPTLRNQLATKRALVKILAAQPMPGSCQVPSDYFLQLSNNETPGLWLTGINIEIANPSISFTGQSRQPELVMQFVQSLNDEKCFRGRQFATVKLNKADNSPAGAPLDFVLSTAATTHTK